MREKPLLPTPSPEDTQMDAVYIGIAIGLLLLVAGLAVCALALCKKRCNLIKHDPMEYGVMDNSAFSSRAELPFWPCGCPGIHPRGSDGRGLSISVYPWKKEVEQGATWKDAKLSFANPLYN